MGCYGVNATDCERVTGPVQSLASHDSLAGNYSRAYMMLSLVNVYDEARPVYVDLAGSDATASLTVTASPTYGATESLVLTTPTAIPADAEFSALRMQGTQFLMLPNLQPGDAEAHTGLAILLWETGETFPEGTNTDWFLGHLGTIGIEANLSAFDVTSPNATFDAARALAPLANVASAAQARVVTDKDDPDGDGYSTLVELRGGSNPLSRASTPYTDDDADGVANGADLVPFLDERALLTAASGGSGPEPFAQALARIVAAYQPRL